MSRYLRGFIEILGDDKKWHLVQSSTPKEKFLGDLHNMPELYNIKDGDLMPDSGYIDSSGMVNMFSFSKQGSIRDVLTKLPEKGFPENISEDLLIVFKQIDLVLTKESDIETQERNSDWVKAYEEKGILPLWFDTKEEMYKEMKESVSTEYRFNKSYATLSEIMTLCDTNISKLESQVEKYKEESMLKKYMDEKFEKIFSVLKIKDKDIEGFNKKETEDYFLQSELEEELDDYKYVLSWCEKICSIVEFITGEWCFLDMEKDKIRIIYYID